MKKKLPIILLVSFVVVIVIAVIVVQFANGGKNTKVYGVSLEPEEGDSVVETLDDWSGQWNTLYSYLEDDTYADVRKKAGNKWKSTYASDLISLRIEGTAYTAYSERQDASGLPSGDILFNLAYTPVGARVVDNEEWYQFETNEDSPYRYLILQPVQQKGEDAPKYFYYRYGNESFDALYRHGDSWKPMMVSFDATEENLSTVLS